MALMKCSECDGEVSDKASVCPHCGFPLLRTRTMDSLSEKSSKAIDNLSKKSSKAASEAVTAVVKSGNFFLSIPLWVYCALAHFAWTVLYRGFPVLVGFIHLLDPIVLLVLFVINWIAKSYHRED